ncbi:MAG: MotA/TolQ/ExbB proton channel family protein [Opitutales bacterium]
MDFILEGVGVFIYPLALCSLVAVYVIIERIISLRQSKIVPKEIEQALLEGKGLEDLASLNSVAGRILYLEKNTNSNPEALKAFAAQEMIKLERAMFLLDIVVSVAPLLGLLGTVAGLVKVFSGDGLPEPDLIAKGVGLALSTTVLGLAIAIPALAADSYIYRRIETLAAKINLCVERLIDIKTSK